MDTPQDWLQRGTALTAAHPWTSGEFEQGLAWMRRAADGGAVRACLALGHLYARLPVLPNAANQCAHWYRQAAEQKDPVAQDRMADLCMLGYGVPKDDTEAYRWYTRTADQAYPHACCNLAYMQDAGLGTDVDGRAATQNYLRAAALADARGLFNLGLRYAQAGPSQQAPAYACLALAAHAQYPMAAAEWAELTAHTHPTARERGAVLADGLRLCLHAFQQRVESDAALAAHPATLMQFALDNLATQQEPAFTLAYAADIDGDGPHQPRTPQTINPAPRIFTVDEFVSRGECAHLLALATERLRPANESTSERLSGEQNAFSGRAAVLSIPDGDAVVRNIERRIAAAFDLPATHVEPLSVLCYGKNDAYAPHVDYFVPARIENNLRIGDRSGQRMASFLVYLRAPEQGGATHYLRLGKKISGRPRMALCHFNLTPAGLPDETTLHTGEPVRQGEKWLARTTLREKPFF